ncbi:unnamed protein product, partial [Pocillopora meandrina]
IDIFDNAIVLIPVHLPGNWALGVFYQRCLFTDKFFVVDVIRKVISCWDSLKQCAPPTKFFENIR